MLRWTKELRMCVTAQYLSDEVVLQLLELSLVIKAIEQRGAHVLVHEICEKKWFVSSIHALLSV